jgi:type IV secretion system protein VirD4
MAYPYDQRSILADPGAWQLGRYWHKETQRPLDKLFYSRDEPVIVAGRNRSGKDSGIGTYNALQLSAKSLVYIDPRAETAAITLPYRRTLGPVFCLNPFGLLTDIPGYEDLKSTNYNPLRFLNPASPRFYEDCAAIAEALIQIEGKDPHWAKSARGLCLAFIMDEVKQARRERRTPSLFRVRLAITEADVRHPRTGRLVSGLAITVARLVRDGGPQIASLLGRFGTDNEETQGVRAEADAQTQWLISDAIAKELDDTHGGLDMRVLGDRPCTLYVLLPSEMVSETHAIWLRLIISSAMRALYRPRPHGVVCSFWLNEFRALGELKPVADAMGLVAGYGIQPIPVLQSLTQLTIYDQEWENFLGQAGAIVHVGRCGDNFTAEYLSKMSGEASWREPGINTSFNPGGPPSISLSEHYGRGPYLRPQDLMRIRDRFGFIWADGRVIPAYFPGYFDVDLLNDRGGRARRNPHYRG